MEPPCRERMPFDETTFRRVTEGIEEDGGQHERPATFVCERSSVGGNQLAELTDPEAVPDGPLRDPADRSDARQEANTPKWRRRTAR